MKRHLKYFFRDRKTNVCQIKTIMHTNEWNKM